MVWWTEEELKEEVFWWTAEELKAAINRCEDECAELVRQHAKPEDIAGRREGLDYLYVLLRYAERGEGK